MFNQTCNYVYGRCCQPLSRPETNEISLAFSQVEYSRVRDYTIYYGPHTLFPALSRGALTSGSAFSPYALSSSNKRSSTHSRNAFQRDSCLRI